LAGVELSGVKVERSVVVNIDAAGAVHEALRRLENAVICMASHGRGRSAALVGSVATDVVRRCHDPLIVVGPFVDDRRWARVARGIVACVDETASPGAAPEIDAAAQWTDLLAEPLTVITVAEPVPDPLRPVPVHRAFGPDGDVDAFLAAIVEPLRSGAGERESERDLATAAVLDPISPVEGIVSYVDAHLPYLVVLGSRTRSGLARLVWGSVSAGVVHRSASPVVVVPRFETEG
jgi:nucleotide-binding universal stress UspA family protein